MLFNTKQGQGGQASTSIIKGVTLWYSGFILLLLLGIVAFAVMVSGSFVNTQGRERLERSALEMSRDLDDYEAFEDGIYYGLYDQAGSLETGSFPQGFDSNLPLVTGQIQTLVAADGSFDYYDLPLGQSGRWLRAVRIQNQMSEDYRLFLLALGVIAPLVLVVIVFGGYLILKRAFVPVHQIAATAQAISQSHDFSQRIPIGKASNELTDLAVTINGMLAEIESSFSRERQFNNDISHELRTPLTVILSESEFSQTYAQDVASLKESNRIIQRQARQMTAMVEDILALSRLEGQPQLALEPVDLSALVEEKLVDCQRLFADKGLALDAQLAQGVLVGGNALLLTRLLDNLLSNAVKFTKDRVQVSLSQIGESCLLTVADNGQGIAPDQQEKIWQKFYQVDEARTKTSQQGVGLGLSLVQEIVRQHQGQIAVQSQEGQGAQFQVTLPLWRD